MPDENYNLFWYYLSWDFLMSKPIYILCHNCLMSRFKEMKHKWKIIMNIISLSHFRDRFFLLFEINDLFLKSCNVTIYFIMMIIESNFGLMFDDVISFWCWRRIWHLNWTTDFLPCSFRIVPALNILKFVHSRSLSFYLIINHLSTPTILF